jgi:hypothetical protein
MSSVDTVGALDIHRPLRGTVRDLRKDRWINDGKIDRNISCALDIHRPLRGTVRDLRKDRWINDGKIDRNISCIRELGCNRFFLLEDEKE